MFAQPVPGGLGDGDNVRYSTTPSGNRDFTLGWFAAHPVECAMDFGLHVFERSRDQLLVDLVKVHKLGECYFSDWIIM
jgi:hypothetical protein